MRKSKVSNPRRSGLFRIQQTGSPIRRQWWQRANLIGLGLNKIGRIAAVPNTPQTWGMIRKVAHLISFPDQAEYEKYRMPRPHDVNEDDDNELVKKLVFGPRTVQMRRFSKKEMRNKKRPTSNCSKTERSKATAKSNRRMTNGSLTFLKT